MTAALAVIARLVLGAVLLLAFIGAMFLAQFGPRNWPLVVWLLAVCAVITGASLGVSALRPGPRRDPGRLTGGQLEAARRLAADALADGHLPVERHAGQAVPGHLEGGGGDG